MLRQALIDAWIDSIHPLSKMIAYVWDSTFDKTREILDKHKIARDDVAEYQIQVLQRQQIINQRLVDWWEIKEGDDVLDACCWPEWSSLAVLRKKANWYGNEISQKTYEHLLNLGLNVTHGKAEQLKYDDELFDFSIYCYSINNIQATPRTFQESSRVLKENWSMLVADPWMTKWLTDIILFSLIDSIIDDPIGMKDMIKQSPRFNNYIPKYFKSKNFEVDDYAKVLFSWLLGLNKKSLLNEFPNIFHALQERYVWRRIRIWSISSYFHLYLNAIYWENLVSSAEMTNMKLEKLAFFTCTKSVWSEDWELCDSIDLSLQDVWSLQLRQLFTQLQLPNWEHAQHLQVGKKGIEKLLPTVMFSFKNNTSL